MALDDTHPALEDLRRRARRRVPRFVWEYLDSAAGDESAARLNRSALDATRLVPRSLRGVSAPDPATRLMGRDHPLPFGIAPVGMSGLIWPDAERALARLAARERIPYGLSTVASRTPEEVGPHVGDQGWFQLYPPGDAEIRADMLRRARDAGFHTLILTVDVPAPARRERQRRAQLTSPMRLTPRIAAEAALAPEWALRTLRLGTPRFRTLDAYAREDKAMSSTAHVGYLLRVAPDWDYLAALREAWHGKLVVKGVLDADDARRAAAQGADAVWVSNHGGRQFAAAPPALAALPAVRAAVPAETPVIFDGGVRSGTDVLRAIALGADFVMLGRAFHWGLAAFGERGAAHAVHILREEIKADMSQLGCATLTEAREIAVSGAAED